MSVLGEVVAVVRGVEAVAGPFWVTVRVLTWSFSGLNSLRLVLLTSIKGSWYDTAHKDIAE